MSKEIVLTPPSIFTPEELSAMTDNNFTPIEWQGSNVKFDEILKKIDPNLLEQLFAKSQLRTYLGKRNHTFFMLVSTNGDVEHHQEYSSLIPSSIHPSIKVVGHLSGTNQDNVAFYLSAVSLYRAQLLRRDQSVKWMKKNLPSWNQKPMQQKRQINSFLN